MAVNNFSVLEVVSYKYNTWFNSVNLHPVVTQSVMGRFLVQRSFVLVCSNFCCFILSLSDFFYLSNGAHPVEEFLEKAE